MKKLNKVFISCMASLIAFTVIPSNSSIASSLPTEIELEEEFLNEVSQEDIDKAEKIVSIIENLEEKLDMEELQNNTKENIDSLDQDSKEFYYLYEKYSQENNNKMDAESVFKLISAYANNDYSITSDSENQMTTARVNVKVKEYKISNQRVRDVVNLVGIHGTGWAFAIALAKKFGKNPTWVTLMIVAVPALGAAGLNACNRKNKGIIITRTTIGATSMFSCKSQ